MSTSPDLNKAFPKDDFPLPCIDQLVDTTSGCELMSFLDAYFGYHQVLMAKEDKPKIAFIMAKEDEPKTAFITPHRHILLHSHALWLEEYGCNLHPPHHKGASRPALLQRGSLCG